MPTRFWGDEVEADLVVSKIPNSDKGLLLLTMPAQKGTNQANIFLIARAGKQQTDVWAVLSNLPVANGQLDFDQGKAEAGKAKAFLKEHADEFVAANRPLISLRPRTAK